MIGLATGKGFLNLLSCRLFPVVSGCGRVLLPCELILVVLDLDLDWSPLSVDVCKLCVLVTAGL